MTQKLVTEWFKVATAGPTADNRDISEQSLLDMAATYDPAEYTAVIWWEHYRFINLGDVVEVKAEKDGKGRMCLFAKLCPNDELLAINKADQKVFTSIEILDNFAKSGKAYLGGLAVTDQPASLGTDKLFFSKNAKHPDASFTAPFEAGKFSLPEQDEGGLGSLLRRFLKPEVFKSTPLPEEFDMTEAQAKALMDGMAALQTAAAEQAAKFATLETEVAALKSAAPGAPAAAAAAEETTKTFTAEDMTKAIEPLTTKLADIEKQFNELKALPAGATNRTEFPGNNGTTQIL